MTNIQNIQNVSDCVPLYLPHSLYLKPLARLNISVALPSNKMGKSISNLDLMEKLSAALKPDRFLHIKASKSTIEFIRFEAELDDRSRLRSAISRLDGVSLKLSAFTETFRVRASEPKEEFPTRHDWDSFFRDAAHMDEMKAGERPDTIHLTHLPVRWFCPRHAEHEENPKPSESIFRRIFEKFGSVRCVDIPTCDPYRRRMNADISGMRTLSHDQDVLFEAYVQFDEYVGFVRVMDEFRGMKLVRKYVDKTLAINIGVTFDRTKHLSDAQLQRRDRVRKRLIDKAKAEDDERDKQKQLEQQKIDEERIKQEQAKLDELAQQREREVRRKAKHMKKIQERGQVEISQKIRVEERKLMIAQRKLESIRVLEQLFERIRLKHVQKLSAKTSRQQTTAAELQEASSKNVMRDRLIEKYKSATEKLLNDQKRKVEEIKRETPLLGLLKSDALGRSSSHSSDNEPVEKQRPPAPNDAPPIVALGVAPPPTLAMNPFKAVAALAAAGGAPAAVAPYTADAATEWMKSLSMLSFMQPSMFPGMAANLYRSQHFGVSPNYRGFAPRSRPRGRGRGRGRGGYDYQPSYHNNYKHHYDSDHYNEEEDGDSSTGYHHKSSYGRSRNRSRSRSRSRNRRHRHYSRSSRSRSRSRHRRSRSRSSRPSTSSRSRSRSRSRTAAKSGSKSRSRRDRCSSGSSRSHSRSRSRSHRSRRERNSRRSSRGHSVALETEKLVRSAEQIKRNIESDTRTLLREEERQIKDTFRRRKDDEGASNGTHAVDTEKTAAKAVEETLSERVDETETTTSRQRHASNGEKERS